jgi:hypothetical protein
MLGTILVIPLAFLFSPCAIIAGVRAIEMHSLLQMEGKSIESR